jgi:hypothetical protein
MSEASNSENPLDAERIRDEIKRVTDSGALGRSRTYGKLLAFLVDCSLEGRAPKELEIATEVFGKGADFDPNQDSLVRVYMHNLRQKLEHFNARTTDHEGYRLRIPKGEYRLIVEPADAVETLALPQRRRPYAWMALAAALLALNLVTYLGLRGDTGSVVPPSLLESSIWADILDDEVPILIVVGDYYIFGELDERGNVSRLIRDFSINSPKDLDELFMYSPELMESYYDLDLTYLPQASGYALMDLLRVVYSSDKPVRVTPMSELSAADLKSSHVIYVGYISALDTLMEFVFASSKLAVGETYDELVNRSDGEQYTSGAGMLRYSRRNYRDYGFLSTFPGPGGNRFLIISGTRDAGVMQVAQAVTSAADVAELEERLEAEAAASSGSAAFEALYEVTGFDRMNLDAMLVHWALLDYGLIWRGELPQ